MPLKQVIDQLDESTKEAVLGCIVTLHRSGVLGQAIEDEKQEVLRPWDRSQTMQTARENLAEKILLVQTRISVFQELSQVALAKIEESK